MKFPIVLALFFLATTTVAGGIRRSYEIMALWYTYQARIEQLWASDGNLKRLDIIPLEYGKGPHDTLTFNAFVEYVSRPKNSGPRTAQSIVPETNFAPDISNTAYNMFSHRQQWGIAERWEQFTETDGRYRIITGVRSYTALMRQMGQLIWDMSQSGHLAKDDPNIRQARAGLEMVRVNRQVDYDRFYLPAVKAAPQFAGVTWIDGTPIHQRGEPGGTRVLWLEETLGANSNRPNLGQELIDWQKRVYFQDPGQGEDRVMHWEAYEMARQAGEISTTGACKK